MRSRYRARRNFLFVRSAGRYILSGILIVIAFFAARAAWHVYQTYAYVANYANTEEASGQALVERKNNLETDIARLETAFGKEAELRRRYGAAKPGEGVYIFVEEKR